ncbi:MAG: GTPase ObgE [Dehalococcoidales bacterium]|nr:GTPase ObgE [Dehalococcoidales bacterium]
MLDKVEIIVKAGGGGDGVISFRREKFAPFGGPNGGIGGKGGDVIVKAEPSVTDLRRFNFRGIYRADDGRHGEGNTRHGRSGKDMVLGVPPGTIVSRRMEAGKDMMVADLEQSGQETVVAGGGKGGWGNTHFVSSTNQAPLISQKGEPGEEVIITLEMRIIADVGIIAYPNAGKSTLLTAASSAHPKIAEYPFTTLEPVLGVVEVGKGEFTLAEIPGLIEGAHLGKGLGHDFLRHAMRTKMFIHLIDASSPHPVEDMVQVNNELALYARELADKSQVVVLNKIDLPEVEARLPEIKAAFEDAGVSPQVISAMTGRGVPELMTNVAGTLKKLKAETPVKEPEKVFRPRPRPTVAVHKEGDIFVVEAPELERLVSKGGVTGLEIRWQLKRRFARVGVDKALQKAGIQPGDKVRCGRLEWEW